MNTEQWIALVAGVLTIWGLIGGVSCISSFDTKKHEDIFYKHSLPQRLILYFLFGPFAWIIMWIVIPLALLINYFWHCLDPKPEVEQENQETWKV